MNDTNKKRGMMAKNLRDHGLGVQGEPNGKPSWKKIEGGPACPNCEGDLVHVSIPMKNVPMLKGGEGNGVYLGCPCCPYASPMMIVSSGGKSK